MLPQMILEVLGASRESSHCIVCQPSVKSQSNLSRKSARRQCKGARLALPDMLSKQVEVGTSDDPVAKQISGACGQNSCGPPGEEASCNPICADWLMRCYIPRVLELAEPLHVIDMGVTSAACSTVWSFFLMTSNEVMRTSRVPSACGGAAASKLQ